MIWIKTFATLGGAVAAGALQCAQWAAETCHAERATTIERVGLPAT